MPVSTLLLEQLADPFRIGLIAFLVATARNTASVTGFALPLLLGVVFVAVIIPVSFDRDAPDLWSRIGVGLLANVILLALALAVLWVWRRIASLPASR